MVSKKRKERRKQQFQVRMTDAEKAALVAKAGVRGLSEYARERLVGHVKDGTM